MITNSVFYLLLAVLWIPVSSNADVQRNVYSSASSIHGVKSCSKFSAHAEVIQPHSQDISLFEIQGNFKLNEDHRAIVTFDHLPNTPLNLRIEWDDGFRSLSSKNFMKIFTNVSLKSEDYRDLFNQWIFANFDDYRFEPNKRVGDQYHGTNLDYVSTPKDGESWGVPNIRVSFIFSDCSH